MILRQALAFSPEASPKAKSKPSVPKHGEGASIDIRLKICCRIGIRSGFASRTPSEAFDRHPSPLMGLPFAPEGRSQGTEPWGANGQFSVQAPSGPVRLG